MIPSTRDEFKEWVLRRLGHPVIEINVDEIQLDDRIDEAISEYQNFHGDAVERILLKHQITSGEIANNSIDIPEEVIGIVKIYPPTPLTGLTNVFNPQYEFKMNDFYSFVSTSMIDYYLIQRHLNMIGNLMGTDGGSYRYTRYKNKLDINMDWSQVNAGDYLVIEANRVLNPTIYPLVWNDQWLRRYAVALVREQWANNLIKYIGLKLPGGVEINAQALMEQSLKELEILRQELQTTWSTPPYMIVG